MNHDLEAKRIQAVIDNLNAQTALLNEKARELKLKNDLAK